MIPTQVCPAQLTGGEKNHAAQSTAVFSAEKQNRFGHSSNID
jgi:hypothetical protein